MKFILSPNWRPQATRPRIANARAVSEKLLLRPQPRSARHRCKRTASRASAGSDATSAVVGVEALSTGSQKSAKSANGRSTGRYVVSISASRAEPQCCRSSAKVGNGALSSAGALVEFRSDGLHRLMNRGDHRHWQAATMLPRRVTRRISPSARPRSRMS